MTDILAVFLAVVLLFFLSFANGGNDVSKAVATLAGAGVTSVRGAIAWGTLWTVAGALAGLLWGGLLIKNINGSIYSQSHNFYMPLALAVSIAPILWVALATRRGWPVSTTHAIVGGFIGAGLIAYGSHGINWSQTFSKIVLPLLASPFIALALAWFLTPWLERSARFTNRIRVCLTPVPRFSLAASRSSMIPLAQAPAEDCLVCDCNSPQAGLTHGVTLSVDNMHWLTSGLLSFSRGLNDTPKLIAVVMPFLMLDGLPAPEWLFFWAALAMGAGSWLAGKHITDVLAFKVTKMNHEEGFSANLVASFLVIVASRFGLPVSTTQVSASAIMGVGLGGQKGLNTGTVKSMLFAWLVTVPAAGVFAALIYVAGTSLF